MEISRERNLADIQDEAEGEVGREGMPSRPNEPSATGAADRSSSGSQKTDGRRHQEIRRDGYEGIRVDHSIHAFMSNWSVNPRADGSGRNWVRASREASNGIARCPIRSTGRADSGRKIGGSLRGEACSEHIHHGFCVGAHKPDHKSPGN